MEDTQYTSNISQGATLGRQPSCRKGRLQAGSPRTNVGLFRPSPPTHARTHLSTE